MGIELLGALALALALPGSFYLLLLTLAALRPAAPARTPDERQRALRLAIVVPAHNEAQGITRTLHSLQAQVALWPNTRLLVVADNCSDETAAVARAAGAVVLVRDDPLHRGKGQALRHAFAALGDRVDWLLVVDADTDVAGNFIGAMRAAMQDGVDALQCRYGMRDPDQSAAARLTELALGAWNLLRPRGRMALGLSAGILGNGFALSRRTLDRVPYLAESIVEDVEYHHLLIEAGLRVHFVDATTVLGDMPLAATAAGAQRARWEGGRLGLLLTRGPALLRRLLQGQWRLADPLLDLMLPPLAWLLTLQLQALALGSGLVRGVAAAALLALGLHVLVALKLIHADRRHLRALLGLPRYLVWKLSLLAASWRASRRHAGWVRSARPGE